MSYKLQCLVKRTLAQIEEILIVQCKGATDFLWSAWIMKVMDLLLSDAFDVWLHQDGEDHETTEHRLRYFCNRKSKFNKRLLRFITNEWEWFDEDQKWITYRREIEYWIEEHLFETPLNLFLKDDEYKLRRHSVLGEHTHYMFLSVRQDKIETLEQGFGIKLPTTPTYITQMHPVPSEPHGPTT